MEQGKKEKRKEKLIHLISNFSKYLLPFFAFFHCDKYPIPKKHRNGKNKTKQKKLLARRGKTRKKEYKGIRY